MNRELSIKSPAKVNLHLKIGKKRADGFHDIVSIFQMISLYDEIKIRSLKQDNVCLIEGDFNFPDHENLIFKAVTLFREKTGIHAGIKLSVKKNIPEGAGLGGGSSNAASVIIGLDKLYKTNINTAELYQIGALLGSDVPFFMKTPAALVTGRGEKIKGLTPRKDFCLIIVYPGIKIITGNAYKWLDAINEQEIRENPSAVEEAYLEKPPEKWNYENSFYKVLCRKYSVLKKIINEMYRCGASILIFPEAVLLFSVCL